MQVKWVFKKKAVNSKLLRSHGEILLKEQKKIHFAEIGRKSQLIERTFNNLKIIMLILKLSKKH